MAVASWALWALGAMASYATNNFLLGAIGETAKDKADANISAIFIVWLVAGLCGAFALARHVSKEKSMPALDGTRKTPAILAAIGVLIAGAMFSLSLALATDPASAGPITAMLPLNSLIVASLSWKIFGESLGVQQLLGMCIAIAGPVCMALADMSGNALLGLMFGAFTACVFGFSNFLRKWVAKSRGCNNQSILIYLLVIMGVCAAICIVFCLLIGRGLKGLDTFWLVVYAIVSGLLWTSGTLCFQYALAGLAGPASAIANTNSVGVLLLDVIFFHPTLQPLKLVGMSLCVTGCAVLSLAKPKAPTAPADLEARDSMATSLQKPSEAYDYPQARDAMITPSQKPSEARFS